MGKIIDEMLAILHKNQKAFPTKAAAPASVELDYGVPGGWLIGSVSSTPMMTTSAGHVTYCSTLPPTRRG